MVMDFVPDSAQLSTIFSQAVAPAFLLGAVAAFISLLMSRLKNVLDRLGGGALAGGHRDVPQLNDAPCC
jgi:hypothetical protein